MSEISSDLTSEMDQITDLASDYDKMECLSDNDSVMAEEEMSVSLVNRILGGLSNLSSIPGTVQQIPEQLLNFFVQRFFQRSSAQETDFQCWICLQHTVDEFDELVSPCNCCGGTKWVHRNCLFAYLSSTNQDPFSHPPPKCPICLSEYEGHLPFSLRRSIQSLCKDIPLSINIFLLFFSFVLLLIPWLYFQYLRSSWRVIWMLFLLISSFFVYMYSTLGIMRKLAKLWVYIALIIIFGFIDAFIVYIANTEIHQRSFSTFLNSPLFDTVFDFYSLSCGAFWLSCVDLVYESLYRAWNESANTIKYIRQYSDFDEDPLAYALSLRTAPPSVRCLYIFVISFCLWIPCMFSPFFLPLLQIGTVLHATILIILACIKHEGDRSIGKHRSVNLFCLLLHTTSWLALIICRMLDIQTIMRFNLTIETHPPTRYFFMYTWLVSVCFWFCIVTFLPQFFRTGGTRTLLISHSVDNFRTLSRGNSPTLSPHIPTDLINYFSRENTPFELELDE
ncbi:hypothetical protein PCE1_000570 [Barthelona sp. PCE]